MTEENRHAAVATEWPRSAEAMKEAQTLAAANLPAGAVSRAYYAAFHAARALLFSLGMQPRSHEGVRSMISLHFVRTGRMDPRVARILSQASRAREDADYDASAVFADSDAADWIRQAREFIAAARAVLDEGGFLAAPK